MAISSNTTGYRPGVCTSTSRPSSPYTGQAIYETNTNLMAIWNGSVWVYQGSLIFTNEAARDAVLTAPTEGMTAFLTVPTVPAATGATTILPTGIITAYNGTTWTCLTPISAYTAASGTTTSTGFTATLSGTPGTNPSVTLTTGTTASITIYSYYSNTASNGECAVSVAVSGATTIAATAGNGLYQIGVANHQLINSASYIISGLTAGTNTFTLNYLANGGTTTVQFRRLVVSGCL